MKVFSPAAWSMVLTEARAVEPKPSSGTVSLMTDGALVSSAKFSACSLESMIRRNSAPPVGFSPPEGTKYCSAAVPWKASCGIALSGRDGTGAPVMSYPSGVTSACSFSIQEPEG